MLKYATGSAAQSGTWETTAYVMKTGRMPPPVVPQPPTRVDGCSTLTDPLVAEGVRTAQGLRTVVFAACAENSVYAIDAGTGTVIWQRRFPNAAKDPRRPTTTRTT